MRKTTHILLLIVFVCSATVFAAEFKLYPGAKIDERATSNEQTEVDSVIEILNWRIKDPASKLSSDRIDVYTTSDSFEKVCIFYKRIGKEIPGPYSRHDTGKVTKTKSGLTAKTTAFTLDGKASIPESNLWVVIERPYLGEPNYNDPGDAKYLDELFDYISDVTAIIVEKRILGEKGLRNEYGGRTEQHVFSASDEGYKKGVAKQIFYYDSNKKKVKTEQYYTGDHTRNRGLTKAIFYYDSNEKRVKTEQYYTDDYARKEGVAKIIFNYDSSGIMVKKEVYDRNGKLLQGK
jgi:predicted GNAT family acetyltransferase